jgi:hypothetical protein
MTIYHLTYSNVCTNDQKNPLAIATCRARKKGSMDKVDADTTVK